MNMVEKVARAICDEVNDQPYDELPQMATYMERKTHVHRPILDRQEARQVARAAIGAMRGPTSAMKAAASLIPHARDEEIYRAMIEAALSE